MCNVLRFPACFRGLDQLQSLLRNSVPSPYNLLARNSFLGRDSVWDALVNYQLIHSRARRRGFRPLK